MPSLSERIALHESTDHSAGGIPTKDAYTLWREWYAMEDIRPAGTVGDPAYDSWTAECARIYTAARDTEARATLRIDPATGDVVPYRAPWRDNLRARDETGR